MLFPTRSGTFRPSMSLVVIGLVANTSLAGQEMTPRQIYDKVKDSILIVFAVDGNGRQISQGSGVKLPNGYLVTNYHVIEKGIKLSVGHTGVFTPATLVAFDKRHDLALLDAPALQATPVLIGSTAEAELRIGDPVCAIGAPVGRELTISNGIVSQLRAGDPPVIQTTAAVSPGSSGGGLFDGKGRLVGITTLTTVGAQNLNYAVPVEWVDQLKVGQGLVPVLRASAEWMSQIVKLQHDKKYPELLSLAQAMVKAVPDDEKAWVCLGGAFADNQRYAESLDAYKKAIELSGDNGDVCYNAGVVSEKLGHYAESVDFYQKALKADGQNAAAWHNLGVAYGKQGKDTEAIDAYSRAMKLEPEQSETWYNLGIAYGRLGRHPEALEALQQAVKRRRDDPKIWNNLGVAYGRLDRYSEAIEAHLQAVRLNPDSGAGWNNLGLGYGALGKHLEALDAHRHALKIDSENVLAWSHMAVTYGRLKRSTEAEDAFRQALRIDSKNAEVWSNQGDFLKDLQRYPEAIVSYKKSLDLDPKQADAWSRLGLAQASAGNKDAAMDVVRKLRTIDPAKADQLFNRLYPQ